MRLRPLSGALLATLLLVSSLARGADTLIGSIFGTRFPGNEVAYGGALSWQHTLQAGGLLLGASEASYPVGTLSEGDFDAYYIAGAHFTVSGGLSLGAAGTTTGSERLYKGRVSLDSRLNSDWTVHAGYQYVDLDLIHVNLATSSVDYQPSPAWLIRAGGGYSIEGSVADRYADTEIDWFGKQRLYAGAVLGRTGYDPADLGQSTFIERLFQLYLGAALPIAAGTLNIGIDTLSLGDSTRQTLRIGFTQTIKP